MFIAGLGAVCFGLIIGWMAYRILRNRSGTPWLSDLIALLGIIAGAVALAFFRDDAIFGWYAIGLIIGFLADVAMGMILRVKPKMQFWRKEQVTPPSET